MKDISSFQHGFLFCFTPAFLVLLTTSPFRILTLFCDTEQVIHMCGFSLDGGKPFPALTILVSDHADVP